MMMDIKIGTKVKIVYSTMPELKRYVGNIGTVIEIDRCTFSEVAYNVKFDSQENYSDYLDICSSNCIHTIWFTEEIEIVDYYYEI